MSIVDSLKKLAVKLGRAQTPEEIYAPDITTALKQIAVGYGVADDPLKVPGSSIDDVINVLADKIEPGEGGGIPFPEVTVTLNIDQPEYVAEVSMDAMAERIGNYFRPYRKNYTVTPAPQQSVITGGLLPMSATDDCLRCYGISVDNVFVMDSGVEYYYELTFSEPVNMRDMSYDIPFFEIVDLTKPASITITATRTLAN